MTYINNKLILACLLLNSCAYLEYREMYDFAKVSIVGVDDIEIDPSYLEDREFSFIKVKLGRSKVATLTLVSVQDNIYEWIGANNERIITMHGRVIATSGLEYNLQILNTAKIGDVVDIEKNLLISLSEPSAIVSQSITSFTLGEDKLELERTYLSKRYKEVYVTDSYKWAGSNYYWIDPKTNLPLKTISSPHPYLDKLEIEFYYKF